MNIVEMLMKLLGGSVSGQLAGLLGQGEDKTQTAVKAALPALLAAFAGATSSKEGAQKLALAVEGADDSILGNLGSVLRGQGSAVAEQGGSMLSNILSGGMLGNLSSVLGKFTGMSPGVITTLLGMLAPVVLGFLKRETKSSGFDPSSLTKLLDGQKENIASALPGGLGSMLGAIPGMGQITSLAQGARETVGTVANRATTAGNQAARAAATETAGAVKWIVPLLLALAVGWLAWTYWPTGDKDAAVAGRDAAGRDASKAIGNIERSTTITAGKITDEIAKQVSNATAEVKDIFADATSAFTNVTDARTADVAAEKLPELTERLGKLKNVVAVLPEAQRKTILTMIAASGAKLLKMIDQVMENPGVSAVLSPHVERLREALDELKS